MHFKISHKFSKYGLHSTHIALHSLVLVLLIQFNKKSCGFRAVFDLNVL